ncbi:MAG: serine/threonine-protein kinase [Nannocystaceae bacterium]
MTESASPSDELPAGTRLAERYVVRRLIGGGGMSQVYLAEHEHLRRRVAIKVLARSLSGQREVVQRFEHEARAASTVQHEHVVEVTDFGQTTDGRPFMVMEYLDGEDLGETLIREGPFTWKRARPILLQVLATLQAAHDVGVIHRDIKPENVFRISRMGSDDFVKVLDFGIAKVLAGSDASTRHRTLTGQVLGTPAYMSPEQCVGDPVDARSDLYSVGVLAYQMLTGHTPFETGAPGEIMRAQVYDTPRPLHEAEPELEFGDHIERVIRKALEKRPSHRYGSAWEFADALFEDIDIESSSLLPGLRNLFRRRSRRG